MSGANTALVLGGGGPLGVIWEAGLLAEWSRLWGAAHALDPLAKARVIGTSAGAIVGAHLSVHGSVDALADRHKKPLEAEDARTPGLIRFLLAYLMARLFTREQDAFRRSLGRSARWVGLKGEQAWVERIARTFEGEEGESAWPTGRELLLTVIDARSGEFQALGAGSGVPLRLAVAASCSMPCVFPLVHFGGRSYMDGGIGSSTNAALAEGCGRVLVLDPLGRVFGKAAPVEQECRELEARGSRTLVLTPSRGVADAVGRNFFDLRRRAAVAARTREQAAATAEQVRRFLGES